MNCAEGTIKAAEPTGLKMTHKACSGDKTVIRASFLFHAFSEVAGVEIVGAGPRPAYSSFDDL